MKHYNKSIIRTVLNHIDLDLSPKHLSVILEQLSTEDKTEILRRYLLSGRVAYISTLLKNGAILNNNSAWNDYYTGKYLLTHGIGDPSLLVISARQNEELFKDFTNLCQMLNLTTQEINQLTLDI